MKRIIFYVLAVFLTFTFLVNQANAAGDTVAFGGNITASEDVGVVWINIKRTGNIKESAIVIYNELWTDNRTTANYEDVNYNPYTAPGNVLGYEKNLKYAVVYFNPGQSEVKIPYAVSNDIWVEESEKLYFEITLASTGTIIGSKSTMYIKVDDNDATLSLNGGLIVEEGNSSTSYAKLSRSINTNVTFRVSTYKGTYKEANVKGAGGDYSGLEDIPFTIKAGSTRVDLPVLTYRNTDPLDSEYESTSICIEPSSVPNTVTLDYNLRCDVITIHDVPVVAPPVVTPPKPVLGNASAIIFGDALGTGWQDTSWGITTDAKATAYAGAYGMSVNYTRPWAGLSFSSNGFDTKNYDTLSFAVRGSLTSDARDVLVVLYLSNGSTKSLPLSKYVSGGTAPMNQWKLVNIPLVDFGAKGVIVDEVVFENGNTGTVLIDSIQFSSGSANPPPATGGTAIITTDLDAYATKVQQLAEDIGNEKATEVLCSSNAASLTKTLALWEKLYQGFRTLVLGNTACAATKKIDAVEDLPSLQTIQNAIINGVHIKKRRGEFPAFQSTTYYLYDSNQPIYWTSFQAGGSDHFWVRPGDYIDGKQIPLDLSELITLYGDYLGQSKAIPWGGDISPTADSFNGKNSIKMEPVQTYGGIQFQADKGINPNDFGALTFAIKTDTPSLKTDVYLKLSDGNYMKMGVQVSNYIYGSVGSDWKVAWIPLRDLFSSSTTLKITDIYFEFDYAKTVWLVQKLKTGKILR